MPDERHLTSLSDSPGASQFDRDLTRLLSIAPSPEFAARVRQGIRDGHAAGHARSTWWLGVAAAAALTLLAMIAARAWRMDDAPREARTAPDVVLPAVAAAPQVQETSTPAPRQRRRETKPARVASGAAETAAAARPRPGVLVSRDQLRAIARLQELIVNGELTEKNLPPVGGAPGAATEIQPAPLTVAPLTMPAVEIVAGPDGPRPRSDR
jgi:hypothetical protein